MEAGNDVHSLDLTSGELQLGVLTMEMGQQGGCMPECCGGHDFRASATGTLENSHGRKKSSGGRAGTGLGLVVVGVLARPPAGTA